jgi:hypothetical protein
MDPKVGGPVTIGAGKSSSAFTNSSPFVNFLLRGLGGAATFLPLIDGFRTAGRITGEGASMYRAFALRLRPARDTSTDVFTPPASSDTLGAFEPNGDPSGVISMDETASTE